MAQPRKGLSPLCFCRHSEGVRLPVGLAGEPFHSGATQRRAAGAGGSQYHPPLLQSPARLPGVRCLRSRSVFLLASN